MSQSNPTTLIHPLFVFLFDTDRFFVDTLKNSNNMDPALHTKLKTAFHKFRKWGLENHNHLVSIADDLENSEVALAWDAGQTVDSLDQQLVDEDLRPRARFRHVASSRAVCRLTDMSVRS